MNIFLIGYRCTGKTTVGRILAQQLGRTFVDADEMLVRDSGVSIAEMVAQKGWEEFRLREREILRRLCEQQGMVIATGGGVILNPENIDDMKRSGTVIWLMAGVETIESRMQRDQNTNSQRPALTQSSLRQEIRETLDFRTPLYEKAADLRIVTDEMNGEEICRMILGQIKK